MTEDLHDDEFAEFDLDDRQFDAIMDRAEQVELVRPPRAGVTMSLGYAVGVDLRLTSTNSQPPNMAAATVPVVSGS